MEKTNQERNEIFAQTLDIQGPTTFYFRKKKIISSISCKSSKSKWKHVLQSVIEVQASISFRPACSLATGHLSWAHVLPLLFIDTRDTELHVHECVVHAPLMDTHTERSRELRKSRYVHREFIGYTRIHIWFQNQTNAGLETRDHMVMGSAALSGGKRVCAGLNTYKYAHADVLY